MRPTVLRPLLPAFAIGLLAFAANATPALAQTSQGAIVSGIASAFVTDSETSVSISVGTGYRFNRAFGLGIEFTAAPSVESDRGLPFTASSRALPVDFPERESQIMVFTTNVRLEVPTTSSRFVPYAVAGGGVANVKESVDVIIALSSLRPGIIPGPSIIQGPSLVPGIDLPAIYPPIPYSYRLSTTSLALTLGGGVSLLAGEHLSIDVDLRYLRILDTQNRNIGRFGAGASYRF
jgi:opacity protein-like surface antigen